MHYKGNVIENILEGFLIEIILLHKRKGFYVNHVSSTFYCRCYIFWNTRHAEKCYFVFHVLFLIFKKLFSQEGHNIFYIYWLVKLLSGIILRNFLIRVIANYICNSIAVHTTFILKIGVRKDAKRNVLYIHIKLREAFTTILNI